MGNEHQVDWDRIKEEVIIRAWSDQDFREELQQSSEKTSDSLRDMLGPEFENVRVHVVFETGEDLYIVVPQSSDIEDETDPNVLAGPITQHSTALTICTSC